MYPQSVHWKRRMGGSIRMLRTTFILQPQRGQGVSVVWSSPTSNAENETMPYDEARQGILEFPPRYQPT